MDQEDMPTLEKIGGHTEETLIDGTQNNIDGEDNLNVKHSKGKIVNENTALANKTTEKHIKAKECEFFASNRNSMIEETTEIPNSERLSSENLLTPALPTDEKTCSRIEELKEDDCQENLDDELSMEVSHSNFFGDGLRSVKNKTQENTVDNAFYDSALSSSSLPSYFSSTPLVTSIPTSVLDVINVQSPSQSALQNPSSPSVTEEIVVTNYKKLELSLDTNTVSDDTSMSELDNSIVISNNNAFPQTDQIVSSNYSLCQLKDYGSDESLNEDSASEVLQYREQKNMAEDKDSDSDSSSTSSSTSIIISDSSDSGSDVEYENMAVNAPAPIKAKGELDIKDLPRIEDLKISVSEEDCTPVGKVFQIVDQLVVVQALKDMPAYDLDTVLFVQGGQPLGKIFDVFGPVTEPYYCVRFNSRDHIREKNISLDQLVYCAPSTKYTNYVFLAQLIKLKGSDASWEHDHEPPEIHLDYSDDEQEQLAKKKKSKNNKAVFKTTVDPDEPARKKHFAYERRMNQRNLQLSENRNQPSSNRSQDNSLWKTLPPPCSSFSNPTNNPFSQNVCQQVFGRPRTYNTQGPPPNNTLPLVAGPTIPNISSQPMALRPPQHLLNPSRCPDRFFSPPSFSSRPGMSPRLSNNPGVQPRPFFPQMPDTPRPLGNPALNNPRASWFCSPPRRENSWTNSPPPTTVNYSSLPAAPFWIQMPETRQNTSNRMIQTPLHTPPRSPFMPSSPPCQASRPVWPTQPPRQTGNASFSPPRFNPNIPPPSQNPFHY